jgi:predicted PurR-regulated permease PerM
VEDLRTKASEVITPTGARQQGDIVMRPKLLRSSDATPTSKLLTLTSVIAVIVGLYFGRQVLIPLALAVVLSFLFSPMVTWLEKRRLGRVPSVIIVMVLAFALVGFGGWMVTGQLMNIVDQFPDYQSNIHDKMQELRVNHGSRLTNASKTVSDLSKELTAASESANDKKTAKRPGGAAPIPVQVAQPPQNAPQYFRTVVGPLTGVLETTAIVVVFTIFMLVKREDLRNRVIRLVGHSQLTVVTQALDEASTRLSRYLFLQFLINAIYGTLFGGGLYFIGVPHPLLWGVLAALLRFVPYIGTAVAAGLPTLMAVAVFPGWHHAMLVVGLFVVLEIVISNFIEPMLYGSHTGISSLAILVAAVFWAALWGPIGLILSTPLTVCLILMGRYVPQLNFLEVILGDEPVLAVEANFYQRLLALDQDEATVIAEKFLEEKPLGNLYDQVVIPALAMAEQDRHLNTLDSGTADFVSQTTRELIDEVGERFFDAARKDQSKDEGNRDRQENSNSAPEENERWPKIFSSEKDLSEQAPKDAKRSPQSEVSKDKDKDEKEEQDYSRLSGLRVTCIAARDEADELVGQMLGQLLRGMESDVRVLPASARANLLADVGPDSCDVVVVSALPPFAAGHARALCKRLRQRNPQLRIMLGLWSFEGGVARALERVGQSYADVVVTSLRQAVEELARATEPDSEVSVSRQSSEPLDREKSDFEDVAPQLPGVAD